MEINVFSASYWIGALSTLGGFSIREKGPIKEMTRISHGIWRRMYLNQLLGSLETLEKDPLATQAVKKAQSWLGVSFTSENYKHIICWSTQADVLNNSKPDSIDIITSWDLYLHHFF